MGVVSTYLSAVAVGALTAGVAASNVVVTPDQASESPDVALAAEFTIPFVDIDQTVGPLTFSRLLALTLGNEPNLFGRLDSEAGSEWDFPRLATNFTNSSSGEQILSAIRTPGESIDFGFTSSGPVVSSWELLGFAGGDTDTQRSRALNFTALTGGAGGLGAALGGTLSDGSVSRNVQVFDSGFTTDSTRQVGDFDGELALMPFDGFKTDGNATVINTNSANTFKLGSLTGAAGGTGALDGRAGLCLGSAQGPESCGGNTAILGVGAPVTGALTLGSTNIISGDFSTNRVVAELGQGQFSVTGAVGGTFSIGSLDIGRPIPIDIQIPRNSSMLSVSGDRQAPTVRDSFRATPRKLGSDNETGGRHRAPLREAVADIKKAVNDAVSGKHAKAETAD